MMIFFPCTFVAIIPPKVIFFDPGVTGKNQPLLIINSFNCFMLTPHCDS